MKHGTIRFVAGLMICVGVETAMAQRNQPLQSPVLGFVYNQKLRELRAIEGLPGAAVLGQPLELSAEITKLHLAPLQTYALVDRGEDLSIGIAGIDLSGVGKVTEIAGALSHPNLVCFSPSGTAAAIFSTSEGLQLITGLPDAPRLAWGMTGNEVAGDLRSFSISDDGTTVLGTLASGALFRIVAGGLPEPLAVARDVGATAFSPASHDALVYDRESDRLVLLDGMSGDFSQLVLAEGLGLGDTPGQILLGLDSGAARITGSAATRIWTVDLKTLRIDAVELPGGASMLHRLWTSGRYLLSYGTGQPVWILDTSGSQSDVSFVPAVPSATNDIPCVIAGSCNAQ